jgi:hypothetical protein
LRVIRRFRAGNGPEGEVEAERQGKPMTCGPALKADEYRQLAAEEAELAKEATSNEARAQHYAMADYYTRLAQAQEKLPGDRTER